MSSTHKDWIASAVKHHGALHRQLGVPEGETIPHDKLSAAAKAPGLLGKRARLAQTLESMHNEPDADDAPAAAHNPGMRQFR